jgi:hypothetical protein
VIDNADLGVSETAMNTAITNAISGVTGASTKTIADLVTLINDLTTRVATLEQTVQTLSTGKASKTDLDALELTVYGDEELDVDGLTTLVTAASLNASNAKATAEQAEDAVTTLSTSVSGLGTRVATLESAGYITQSALSKYAEQQWVIDKKYLTAVPSGYATETWVKNLNYLTAVPSGYATTQWVENKNYLTSTTGFVTTSDTDWKKVKGMFSGVANTTSLLPAQIYLSATSSTYRNRLSYNTDNEFIQTLETQSGGSQTAKSLVNTSIDLSGYVTTTDANRNKVRGMFGGTASTDTKPDKLYLGGTDSRIYYDASTSSYKDVSTLGSSTGFVSTTDADWVKLQNMFSGADRSKYPEKIYMKPHSSTNNNYSTKYAFLFVESFTAKGEPQLCLMEYVASPVSGASSYQYSRHVGTSITNPL